MFGEFEYKPVDGYVICKLFVPDNITLEELLCGGPKIPGSFQYDSGNSVYFLSGQNLPGIFSNLKSNLREHINNISHISNWEDSKKKEEEDRWLESKNHQIGTRIARICL